MSIFEFSIPTKIEFGVDSITRLGHFVSSLGDRVIIVAENVLTKAGIVRNIENILKGKGFNSILYDAVFPDADSSLPGGSGTQVQCPGSEPADTGNQ